MSNSIRTHLAAVGPAIIVASVVLGPGSILTNSKVGAEFGYELVWVLLTACVLMTGMTALAARVGVYLDATPCEELARRLGRPVAVVTGGSLFLVAASFQFSNNLGILFALEPFLGNEPAWWPIVVLVALNAVLIAMLFGCRHLYRPIERLMKLLVGLMILGFAANLLFARPSLGRTISGIVPSLPKSGETADLMIVLGMIATTFSVGGAFYQAYLVKQKGWTRDDLDQGLVDAIVGIATLFLVSLIIMITAAAVLHGRVQVDQLTSAADVARQLEPLFGPLAVGLFCLGIFAGALSSFLVNAMIGGTVLADGLGHGGSMDARGPRLGTAASLLFGMTIAIGLKTNDRFDTGSLIVFAQAITVLGNPLLAGALLWLASRPELRREKAVPTWLRLLAWCGFLAVIALSVRTVIRLWPAEFF